MKVDNVNSKLHKMNVVDLEGHLMGWRSWEEVADFCNDNNISIREASPAGSHNNTISSPAPATAGIAYNTGRRGLFKIAKILVPLFSHNNGGRRTLRPMDDEEVWDIALSLSFQKFIAEYM